jgi:hypothetical protein
MLMNYEAPALAVQAAPLAAHCHTSAPQLAPVTASYAPSPQPWLHAATTGWVSVEMRATPERKPALRETGAAMREIWL